MTNTSKTILFFGTDSFSAPALRALITAGYKIGAVITKPDSKQGRGQQLTPPIVKVIAEEHGIPVWQPIAVNDVKDNIVSLGDVAGVLVSYGKIIPQEIIDLFNPGIINIHPSRLPKYRGPAPIEAAIMNGDEKISISFMKLTAKMDAGPVYGYMDLELNGTETQADLYETISQQGAQALIKLLPSIFDGSTTPLAQDESLATYTHLLTKEDATLEPSAVTADQAERKIRAHLVYPKTKLTINGQAVTLTQAHTSDVRTSLLDQTCKDGRFLVIDQLIGPSGKAMSGKDFLNGYAAG
jgi:methionyl-tRNA formyltransferase